MNAIIPAPMPMGEMQILARAIAASGLFGIKTPDQALVLMSIAQAEGCHPVEAARDYDVINGKPAKKAEAMMRDFIKAGGKVKWHSLTDELADATFTHPQTGEVRIDWDMKRAMTAFGKKDMYGKFPRQMLRSRVVSEGVRTLWPLATSGMYVPEEQADIPPEHNGPTIEHAASDERAAINAEAPLKAPPKPTSTKTARTDEQWRVWLDKLRAACAVLYRRDEVVELGNRASVGDAIAAGPPWVRTEISAILAEHYSRFGDEPEGNDDLPEVEIVGSDKVGAG